MKKVKLVAQYHFSFSSLIFEVTELLDTKRPDKQCKNFRDDHKQLLENGPSFIFLIPEIICRDWS